MVKWRNIQKGGGVSLTIVRGSTLSPFIDSPEHHGHSCHFTPRALEWGFTIYWSTLNLDFYSCRKYCWIKLLFPSWKVFWGLLYSISPFEDSPRSGWEGFTWLIPRDKITYANPGKNLIWQRDIWVLLVWPLVVFIDLPTYFTKPCAIVSIGSFFYLLLSYLSWTLKIMARVGTLLVVLWYGDLLSIDQH